MMCIDGWWTWVRGWLALVHDLFYMLRPTSAAWSWWRK
jgi:hypothetical protein